MNSLTNFITDPSPTPNFIKNLHFEDEVCGQTDGHIYTEISLTKNTKLPKDFRTTIMQFIFSNTELC